MKRFTRQIVLWAAFALFPAAVQGQWIDDYQGVLNDGETYFLDYQNPGYNVASSRTFNGQRVYVGPYEGAFGGGVTAPSFSIICIDFDAYAGDQNVIVTSLADAMSDSDLGNTRLAGAAGSLTRYRQAAYYASLFDSWGALGTDQQDVWTDIHAMIWNGMSDTFSDSGTVQTAFDLNAALDYSADGWYVLTGTGDDPGQEMLVRTRTATVPEPSTYLLMATGLFFLAVLGRKRRDQVEA
ncbi:MAG: PEP-CTERM sorting domain-containing protein [Gemmatimonadota bacterium]